MYRQPWDLAQVQKSAGYDHKDKSNYSLNCQKSRFSARLRKLFQRLRDKDHISNLSLLKLYAIEGKFYYRFYSNLADV